ncbi:hypothetical protein [Dactylosporangium sp. NPDC005555]|uniref:ComEA family DNA-binding protein n=1 Tax=Dactylosporangium sp. NPDC005555 TaxID=3154889 RepID=UPI0033AC7679
MHPAPARPGFGWKVLNSWWLLFPILGVGCLSGVGFVLIGLRARKPGWWGTGIAYLVVETGLFIASDRVLGGTTEEASGPVAAAWALIWFASIVHAFVLNVFWLRWLEQRWTATQAGPAAYGSPAVFGGAGYGSPVASGSPVGPAVPYSAVPYAGSSSTASAGFPVQLPQQYHQHQQHGGPQFPSTSTTPWPAATPWSPDTPAAIDVNLADAGQLGTLEGFDAARISYVLTERHRRGGFTGLADFAATAQLAPYQFERIRHRLTFTPPRPF